MTGDQRKVVESASGKEFEVAVPMVPRIEPLFLEIPVVKEDADTSYGQPRSPADRADPVQQRRSWVALELSEELEDAIGEPDVVVANHRY
jgi:hypothetical protein